MGSSIIGGQNCARGAGGLLRRHQALQRLRTHQRAVAIKNHQPAHPARDSVSAATIKRVARTFLFGLLDEADAGTPESAARTSAD